MLLPPSDPLSSRQRTTRALYKTDSVRCLLCGNRRWREPTDRERPLRSGGSSRLDVDSFSHAVRALTRSRPIVALPTLTTGDGEAARPLRRRPNTSCGFLRKGTTVLYWVEVLWDSILSSVLKRTKLSVSPSRHLHPLPS